MTLQKHIINKQILEIKLPKTADTFKVQQELSSICRNQLTAVMDRIFSQVNPSGLPLQIDQLTLDLGSVSLENFEAVFTEKIQEKLIEYQQVEEVLEIQKNSETYEETPLRAIVHYLKTGVLPWWTKQGNKTDFQQQLEQLIQKPNGTFIKLLKDLQWNVKHLERFVNASTEHQLLSSFELITELSLKQILNVKQSIRYKIQKKYAKEDRKIQSSFWKTVFLKYHKASTDAVFELECTNEILLDLGIDVKGDMVIVNSQYLHNIKSLVASCKNLFHNNAIWKTFFKELSVVITHPFFNELSAENLKQITQLLTDLNSASKESIQEIDVNNILNPLAISLGGLRQELKRIGLKPKSMVIEQFSSPFEDTDFISIQNAGLVLFWPFLERFFENLGVMKDKNFVDETAIIRAICALQYLCDTDDKELFEGGLPLNKLLCGFDIDAVVSPDELSEDEKEIAEGLLTAVIGRGPKWKNLSPNGFRASYLCRQGSLRTRDGHWLLQVQRETHDITLEKLPWGFHTVKLPWMKDILMVEWL
ncbi:contractile injection system tape measure protein [Aquimarina sp. D1M17]|uniref:contractile injection system tape measure protein n=1 Tax=Aquimarina acroporae TaxID=2937283 RepID=UPI0020BF7DB4|nr:contractile injection system tape measure protein [Aquimarina acroporae]MCK8521023.1 contractile injection system tape measure protein [Aquimarina acroporae]